MPNLKISAMPGLGINAAPGDLLTIVDVSAPAATANKRETLNNLLSVITRGITDKALRFQTPGTAPAVSLAAEGSIYFDGSNFQISANGGAYAPLISLSPQADHAVLIGPTSGGPSAPTWRGLALSDLPAIATNRLLGRVSPFSGDVEEITPGAGVLAWLQNPTSANLLSAVATTSTGSGALVFGSNPALDAPAITNGIRSAPLGPRILTLANIGLAAVNNLEIANASASDAPILRAVSTTTGQIPIQVEAKGQAEVRLRGQEIQAINNDATAPGRLGALGGSGVSNGGQLRLYERTTNGANWVGFKAPDSITSNLLWTLPATDGSVDQAFSTNGAGVISWASFASLSSPQADHAVLIGPTSGGPTAPTWRGLALSDLPAIATDRLLGRVSPLSGDVEEITPGAGVLAWLQNPTSANLLSAVATTSTGSGALVFGSNAALDAPAITGGIRNIPFGQRIVTFADAGGSTINNLEIVNATVSNPPILRTVSSTTANISLQVQAKGSGNVQLLGDEIQAINNNATLPGVLAARGGSQVFGGGQLRLYERTTNGTSWVGFEAPDSLASNLFWTLPATDGTAGQGLVTNGGGGLSWAPVALTSGKLSQFAATTSAELAGVITDETGTGALVFGTSPTFTNLQVTSGNTTSVINRVLNTNGAANAFTELQLGNDSGNNGGFVRMSSTNGSYNGNNGLMLVTTLAHPVGIATSNSIRLNVNGAGDIGVRTITPTAAFDINSDTMRLRTGRNPAASSNGNQGDICWGTTGGVDYLYVCVATGTPGTWARVALTRGY